MEEPNDSSARADKVESTPDLASVVGQALSQKQPPPESSSHITRRRWLLLWFWAVAVFLGLPFWVHTTSVHRASLPIDTMNAWAAGQVLSYLLFTVKQALNIVVGLSSRVSVTCSHRCTILESTRCASIDQAHTADT